jgi:hypothetical protein
MKTTLLAATAALTLSAATAFAQPGDSAAGGAFPAGFFDGDLYSQTRQRLETYVAEHEKAVLAERARQQRNAISAASGSRPAGG